jgi:hypothetical protein
MALAHHRLQERGAMSRRWFPAMILGLVIACTTLWVPAVAQSPDPDGLSGPASLPATAASPRMRSVALPTDLPRYPFAAIVAGGPGFIAVGAPEDFGAFPGDSFIVTSPDGLTWTPVDSEVLSGVKLEDITAFPGGFVAVGSTNPGDILTDGVALVSPDGRTWQRASEQGLARLKLYGVTARADGVAAVGVATDRDGVWVRSIVLTSADGIDWTRHRLPRSITDPKVIGAGDGLLAVLDSVSTHEGAVDVTHPVIATTRDLESWTRRELGFDGELRTVTVDGDHVIATGSMNDPRGREHGVLAYSPDAGRRWVRQPLTSPPGSWFTSLSLDGPVIAAGGLWDERDEEHAPAAWTSTIGVDWRQIPVEPSDVPAWIEDFAPFPDRPGGVAVGASGEDYDRPAVWVIDSD